MVRLVEPSSGKAVMPTAQVLALRQRDPWKEATERARQVATARETVVSYVRALMGDGVTQNNAVSLLLERGEAGRLPAHYAVALSGSAKAGRAAPSRSAICEWCALHREGGISRITRGAWSRRQAGGGQPSNITTSPANPICLPFIAS